MFLGVNDDGEVIGINEELASSIKIDFANMVNNKEKINPPIPLMLQEIYLDGKLVLYVYVLKVRRFISLIIILSLKELMKVIEISLIIVML